MAVQWSATSGRMKVGIDVNFSSVNSGSTSVTVTVDYYIQVVNWRYDDNQSLNYVWHGQSGWQRHDFRNSQGSTATHTIKLLTKVYTQGISHTSSQTHEAKANISGAYDGSAPSLTRRYTLPRRPASVPDAPRTDIDSVASNTMRSRTIQGSNNGSGVVEAQQQLSTVSNFSSIAQAWGGSVRDWPNLSPATRYYARSRVRNGVGWSSWGPSDSAVTGASRPSAPVWVNNDTVGQDSARITFGAPSTDGGSGISRYQIQRSTNSGFTAGIVTIEYPGSPTPLSGLEPGTDYWVRVRAVNGVGAGPWSPVTSFTTLLGTPTIITPLDGDVIERGWTYAIVHAVGLSSGRVITLEVSRLADFSAGLLHTLNYNVPARASNDRYVLSNSSQKLANGLHYVRAKVTNTVTGYVTPWSEIQDFQVSHNPAVLTVSPSSGSTATYTGSADFSFRFSDPSTVDRMSAYELVVERNVDGQVAYSSGKKSVSGNDNPQTLTVNVGIPDEYKNQAMRWRVRVWDRDNQVSQWTGYTVFTLAEAPIITLISPPNASTVDNGSPTFDWEVTVPSGGNVVESVIEVRSSSNNALVWTKTIIGAETEATPSSIILANNRSYFVKITVRDSTGLVNSVTNTFSASYEAPGVIGYVYEGEGADTRGYVLVDWSNSDADSLFTHWKVYRLNNSDPMATWELIFETGDQNIRSYRDYLVSSNSYSYSVTQRAYRSGTSLESPVGYYADPTTGEELAENRFIEPDISQYWLIDELNPEDSTPLPNTNSDSSTLEFEAESFNIIGRGRHVDYGDEIGYSGTLTVQVRGVERRSTIRAKVEKLRRNQNTLWLRTPYGRLIQVAIFDLGWSPLPGTGSSEMGDLTIPYEEVK